MIKIFLRQISINLSFFYKTKFKINTIHHLLTEKYIIQKAKDLYFKNPRLSVHENFPEILNLIKKKKKKLFKLLYKIFLFIIGCLPILN